MKTFTDAAGRTWTISLNLGTAMAVRDKLGVDLLQPEAGYPGPEGTPLLTRLGTDELLLGEVLCALLERQFETHQVSETDVRAAFDGQTLLAAQQAFYEELIDFFRLRGRNDRAKAVAKQMALIDAAVTAIETRIDTLDVSGIVEQTMNGQQKDLSRRSPEGTKTGGAMSGSLPEASASIPGR